MANALICDSCEQPIDDMNNRVQVLIFTEEPVADPQLDLCAACATDVVRSSKVKRGQQKAKDRAEAVIAQYAGVPTTPVLDEVNPETGEYHYMPEPIPAVVPGIDPRTGVGERADGRPNEWHGPGEWPGSKEEVTDAGAQ